ncbi:MAG: protein-disulfide reductase DsbD family protein [Armatimonadota bacterium]
MTVLYHLRAILAVGAILLLSWSGYAQQPARTSLRIEPTSLQLTLGKPAELTIRVTPPAGHHAYLDTGKDGVLLPVEINPSALEQAGIQVRSVSTPKGEWDTQYGATVLRGEGVFRYALTALPAAKAGSVEYAIEVQSQICNDDTGACYFPQTDTLRVQVTVNNAAARPVEGSSVPREKPVPADPPASSAGGGGKSAAAAVFDFSQYTPQTSRPAHGLLVWMLLAFVAGLVLNVMPCVLPVVSIKVLSFVQQAGESRRRVLGLGLVFAAGMMTVFLALGGAAILFGLGWGQQFQSQAFLIVMIALVFAFSLSLFGVYEFGVPRAVGTLAANTTREGFGSAYLKGVLATLLATPCSGPFLGSTLAWTLTQPPGTVLLIFGMLGLGMAVPYVVLTAQPALLKRLPKPGPWMENFKHVMGFLLVGTVVYLMVSLDERLLLFTLMLLVFVALGGWIWGRFSVQIMSAAGRLAVLAAALAVVGAGAYLSFGALRGVLHPPTVTSRASLAWEPFDADRLAQYHREGRSVMLDFTADWCANCTFNEVRVYNSAPVRGLLKEKNVVAMKADLTREGPSTEKIRGLMAQLGARSIPFLAVFPGDRPLEPYTLYDLVDTKTVSNLLKKLPDANSSAR